MFERTHNFNKQWYFKMQFFGKNSYLGTNSKKKYFNTALAQIRLFIVHNDLSLN